VSLHVYIAEEDGSSAVQYLIVPVFMLGTRYPFLAAAPLPYTTFTGIAVASQDGTILTQGSNSPKTLNRLDVFSSAGSSNYFVYANVPFAYIGTTTAHSTIMLLPISSSFLMIPPDLRSLPFTAQITALESGTQVSVNGGSSVDFPNNGPFLAYSSAHGDAVIINATKAVQVHKILPSYEYSYSPEYFLSNSVQFFLVESFAYPANVTIFVPHQSTGNILLDGQAIPALQFRRLASNSTIYYYSQRMTRYSGSNPNGLHTISTKTSDDRYMAEVFYRNSYQKFPIAFNLLL
jgi:hypothetical protein